jgi:hypothetical protein
MKAESIIKPKTPLVGGWYQAKHWQSPSYLKQLGDPVQAWQNSTYGLFVLSAVEVTKTELGEEELGPEYHLSISKYPNKRCSRHEAKIVLKEFGLEDATEDNHVPGGFVRNYWRPVADKFSGYECPCVDREPAMVEDKGDFIWRGIIK